jgi:hypothetical protein
MTRVGIVGAGAAGAAVAHALDGHLNVTVLEKSDVVCGRAATRTRGRGRHQITYDYGANYVKGDDEGVADLLTAPLSEGLVEAEGPVHVFDGEGEVDRGRDADGNKWTYETGISTLGARLFERTDARMRHGVRARRLYRRDGRWTVADDDGEEWGPFDDLVLTPPAPQTARICRAGDPDDARAALADAAEAVPYRSVYTGVCGYEFAIDRPYYALVNPGQDHEAVGWISREECKPGHVPGGQTVLVVQATPGWSVENAETDPDEATTELAGHAADVVGDHRLADPAWTDHKFWRYALADDGVARAPVAAAAEENLHVAGDWVAGAARIHAAVRSGLTVGERIVDRRR